MSDPIVIPNCAITLHFYEGSSRFSYSCTSSSHGWQVQPDGSIHPPSKSRIVQITLNGFPTGDVSFAGFQIASTDDFQGPNWTPTSDLTALGVAVSTPDGYPSNPSGTQTTSGPLTIDFGAPPLQSPPVSRLFYRLAVVVGSGSVLHWDEPKVYDDGTD